MEKERVQGKASEREKVACCALTFFGQQSFSQVLRDSRDADGKVCYFVLVSVCVRTHVHYSIIYHCNLENIVEREVIIHVK